MMSTQTSLKNERKQESSALQQKFDSLAEPTRYRIVKILSTESDVCVGDLAQRLGISSSAVSQACRWLEMSEIIYPERKGQKVCYQINKSDRQLSRLINMMNKEE